MPCQKYLEVRPPFLRFACGHLDLESEEIPICNGGRCNGKVCGELIQDLRANQGIALVTLGHKEEHTKSPTETVGVNLTHWSLMGHRAVFEIRDLRAKLQIS